MRNRRQFLQAVAGVLLIAAAGKAGGMVQANDTAENKGDFPYKLTEAEWKKKLEPSVYGVLRRAATEPAFSSPLYSEHREGLFRCAGCDQGLFLSENKFESGTGWPSFWQPASQKAIGTSTDHKIGYPRTEAHCANCGGHLGHVFEDGPPPTGLRYCINGLALRFVQA
jgi:peptide-methionine (R)-S-oxide reductase